MKRIFFCLLMMLLFLGCKIERQVEKQDIVVCFDFDDNCKSTYTVALPIMEKYGYRGTVFTNSGNVGKKDRLTWAQIDTLYNVYHWEIGGHTLQHPHLSTLTPEEAEYQISADFYNFKSHDINPVSFAPPYGECPAEYYPIIARYYKNIRTCLNLSMRNPIDRKFLGTYQVSRSMSANNVINRVTQGVSDKENLILITFHDVQSSNTLYAYNYDPVDFEDIVMKVHEMHLKVLPLNEALDYLKD